MKKPKYFAVQCQSIGPFQNLNMNLKSSLVLLSIIIYYLYIKSILVPDANSSSYEVWFNIHLFLRNYQHLKIFGSEFVFS